MIVVFAVVLLVQARHADQRLQDARAAVARLRADLVQPDVPQDTIDADAVAVGGPAQAAADITDGSLWSFASHLPFVGSSVRSARGSADAVRTLALQVLPELTQAQEQLRTDHLKAEDGIALAPLRTAAPLLAKAHATAIQVIARVQRLPANTIIPTVDRGRSELLTQLTSLSGELGQASDAARVLPDMLGGSGTRYYFIGFENEAESRGLGGLPGAFAILQATNGRMHIAHIGSDSELSGVTGNVPLAADYLAQFKYAQPTAFYGNSDVSPDFPVAARIWLGMWKAKTGQALDGAIVIDPTALAALLDITGGTSLPDGTQVTGQNVVALTEHQAYVRFSSENKARKEFLQDIARASADRLIADGPSHAAKLAHVAARQIGERRLLVYSAHPDEQSVLSSQPIGGLLPPATGPNSVSGPFLLVADNNAAAGKLDYYLGRSVTYTAAGCSTRPMRTSTVTVRLTNDAPPGLPVSVTGTGPDNEGRPLDTNQALLSVYTTAGAGVTGVTVNGRPGQIGNFTEQGRPVFSIQVNIPRGQTTTVQLDLLEPTAAKGPATVLTQPLVRPQSTTVHVPAC